MKYEELYDDFINTLPEARAYCDARLAEFGLDDTDGVHVYYCFVVRPFISKVLKDHDVIIIKRIAAFMETMEKADDKRIAEVLEQSIMEQLLAEDRKLVAKFDYLWGPETKEAFRAVGQFVA